MAKFSLTSALAELQNQPKTRPGFPCKMQSIYASVNSEEAQAIEAAVMNTNIAIPTILRLLNSNGIEVGYGTLNKHRRRREGVGCKCPIE